MKQIARILIVLTMIMSLGVAYAADEPLEKGEYSYMAVGKAIITNIAGASKQYIRIKVDVLINDHETQVAVKENMPYLRNIIFMTLSDKNAAFLRSEQGRVMLEESLAEQFKATLMKLDSAHNIRAVVFPEYYVD